jgi:DNA-binding transcriptional regulator YdaS (Cro superfamily)
MDFQTRLLERAVEICGGRDAACSRLGVSGHSLGLWIEGKARLPNAVFLKAADLVLEDDIARASSDRRRVPRMDSSANDAGNFGQE